jgi:NAD(P)-dependent dehydrogenase (short-subunit alcohol dehydrogenase family)
VVQAQRGGVVVTGASGGIGAATAQALARDGFSVACISRRGTVPHTEHAHADLHGYCCDVTDEARVREVVADFADGRAIVGLVNNAGITLDVPSSELTSEQLLDVLRLNFVAPVGCARMLFPLLRDTRGLIVNVGSFYDRLGVPRNLAYAASKAALASMGRTLAVEWARHGIRVLTVAPGYVTTDLNREYLSDEHARKSVEQRIPIRRLGTPEEIGDVIAALFANRTEFLTGTTLYVDGGQSISL